MKPYLRYQVVFGLALLIACVGGCKNRGSANKAADKTDATTNDNSTSTTNATNRTTTTTAPIDVAGKYNIVGTNPDGGSYKGTLEVIAHGDVYQFR